MLKMQRERERERDFNYDSNYKFYKLYKRHDEFEEMSLDSKYNRIKEFNKLLIKFKALKPKNPKRKEANYEKYR